MKFIFMNRFNEYFIFSILFFISCHSLNAQDCGIERWKIKTLSDADTIFVNFDTIRKSSVQEQISFNAPYGKLGSRLASETTVYSIDCFIIGFANEDDKDIHIIVEDVNTDETMVIEIVKPECLDVQNTSRYEALKRLYEWFTNNVGIPRHSFTFLKEHKLVTITGIGFWDFLHGQKGMANSGREIHPVLSMQFKQ